LNNIANRQTDRQTNTGKNITYSFVGGKNQSYFVVGLRILKCKRVLEQLWSFKDAKPKRAIVSTEKFTDNFKISQYFKAFQSIAKYLSQVADAIYIIPPQLCSDCQNKRIRHRGRVEMIFQMSTRDDVRHRSAYFIGDVVDGRRQGVMICRWNFTPEHCTLCRNSSALIASICTGHQ